MTERDRNRPINTCLQCGESRDAVNRYRLFCATVTTGEYTEVDAEWERHRWVSWRDDELTRQGIKPEAFEKYRRARVWDLEWADCEDTLRGHAPSEGSDEDREVFGTVKGQCTLCGKRDVG